MENLYLNNGFSKKTKIETLDHEEKNKKIIVHNAKKVPNFFNFPKLKAQYNNTINRLI